MTLLIKAKIWDTFKVRFYTFFKIPMINFTRPRVIKVDGHEAQVLIPLRRRTQNHIKTMYFGSLAVGADLCVGLLGLHAIQESGEKLVLIFKDFKIDFFATAKGDVLFVCKEGAKVQAMVAKVIETRERQNVTIMGKAYTPNLRGDEPVAEFSLTLSIK